MPCWTRCVLRRSVCLDVSPCCGGGYYILPGVDLAFFCAPSWAPFVCPAGGRTFVRRAFALFPRKFAVVNLLGPVLLSIVRLSVCLSVSLCLCPRLVCLSLALTFAHAQAHTCTHIGALGIAALQGYIGAHGSATMKFAVKLVA